MEHKVVYDPEVEYDKIISWLTNNINVDEVRYLQICGMISSYGLSMYERGSNDAVQVIETRIKQVINGI